MRGAVYQRKLVFDYYGFYAGLKFAAILKIF